MPRQYTDAEKMAYYKAKAEGKKAPANKYKAVRKQRKANPKRNYKAAPRSAARGPGVFSSAGSMLGGAAGTILGGPAGTAIGNFLGGKIGHLVDKITGFGDYKVAENSILSGGVRPPEIVNSVNSGGIIVRHREYLGDIYSTKNFTIQTWNVNPGLLSTFPWLSQMASAYEQYKLRGMIFEFNSTSSDSILSSATSTALGTVVMMTDYDISDPIPGDKRTMLNNEFSCSAKPSTSFIHPIECARSQTTVSELYTRVGLTTPAGYDPHLYDHCRFALATVGMQADGGTIGELWITYEIELLKQQLVFPGQTDHFRLYQPSATNPLGIGSTTNTNSSAIGNTLGGSINAGGNSYIFPTQVQSGQYLVTYFMNGTTAAAAGSYTVGTSGCALVNYFVNDTVNLVQSPQSGVTTQSISLTFVVKVTQQTASFIIGLSMAPAVSTQGDLYVTRMADYLSG